MAPSSPPVAAVEALVVATLALCFGRVVVEAILGQRDVDRLTRWALAFPGLVFFSFVLMLLHLISGGLVFSNAWLVRGLTVGTAAILIPLNLARRRPASQERLLPWQLWVVLGACVLAVAAWGSPVARVLPLSLTTDTHLHMGWASQLMVGESSPSTVITGHVPNYYPWLYHALIALLARLTPGGRAFDALGPVQILEVAGSTLGLFGVGKSMTGRFTTGAAASFFGAICGGFGVGALFNPRLSRQAGTHATKIPWLGDVLSRRPYNFAFNNIAPAYPRDVSFALLVGFLLLFLLGLRQKSYVLLGGAGVLLGLVGLAGGEAVIVGGGVALSVCLIQGELRRIRAAAAVLIPAGAVYGTWLIPLIVNYFNFGGFVNTTHVGPVVLTLPFVLLSWGLSIPFAVVGLACNLRSLREPKVLAPLAIIAVTSLIMSSNLITAAFGSAFLTLGRDHRYWALCQLGVALVAALGVTASIDRLKRYPGAAVAVAAAIVLLGSVSPALGSAIFPPKDPKDALLTASLEGRPTLLNAMAPEPDHRCVAAVPGNNLARDVFAYTGYRLVLWVTAPPRHNWARIRWHDIYRYIPGDLERAADNEILTTGVGSPHRWRAVARKYGVNFVVVQQAHAAAPVFDPYPKRRFVSEGRPVTLVRVKAC